MHTFEADRETTARILANEGAPGEYLYPDAAFRLLQAYRFPLVPWRRIHSAEEAATAAGELGYPAVLKVGGRRIVHKSDVGGVIMNIKNALEMETDETLKGRIAYFLKNVEGSMKKRKK